MSYHRDLAKKRPSASEVQDTRRRMNLGPRLDELETRSGELEQTTADLATLVNSDNSPVVPIDDGIPPLAPQNLVATPMPVHAIDVAWDTSDAQEGVTSSVAEVTPLGDPFFLVEGTPHFVGISGLAVKSHSIRVKLLDYWGNESPWSSAVTATPPLTVAEDILDDIVEATHMAPHDLAGINLWVQNAAIASAKVVEIVADKITTGTITAATITLTASGQINAGPQVRLNASGLSLAPTASEDQATANVAYKITESLNSKSAIHFYNDQTTPSNLHRGAVVKAEGNGSTIRSVVALMAPFNTDTLSSTSSRVEIRSARTGTYAVNAEVGIAPRLKVEQNGGVGGDISAVGGYEPNHTRSGFSVGANSTVTSTHSFGSLPGSITAYQDLGSTYKPLPVGTENSVHVDDVTNNTYKVKNNEGTSWGLELRSYKG